MIREPSVPVYWGGHIIDGIRQGAREGQLLAQSSGYGFVEADDGGAFRIALNRLYINWTKR